MNCAAAWMAVYATMFMGVQPIGALIAGEWQSDWRAHTLTIFGSLVLLGVYSLFPGGHEAAAETGGIGGCPGEKR